jgi:hypothetical protein
MLLECSVFTGCEVNPRALVEVNTAIYVSGTGRSRINATSDSGCSRQALRHPGRQQ